MVFVRCATAAAAALVVSLSLFVATTAAPAAVAAPVIVEIEPFGLSECPTGTLCLWAGSQHTGSLWRNTSTDVIVNRPANLSTTKSMWNRTNYYVRLYSGANGTGSTACYAQGFQGTLTGWAAAAGSLRMSTGC